MINVEIKICIIKSAFTQEKYGIINTMDVGKEASSFNILRLGRHLAPDIFFGDYEKVALAARCEEHIMDDPESGNRTGKWFFDMILSLGLIDMYDNRFDAIYTRAVVSSFLRREYAANGCGGRLHCGITTRICGGLKSGIRRCGIWTK